MVQHPKPEIREAIDAAALEVFATKGFERATVAQIARVAGVSTGNVYHYYRGKRDLFDCVVSEEFVERLVDLTTRKVRSLDGVDDVRRLPADAPYHVLSEELLDFCIGHRLQVVILLNNAAKTRCEGFADEMVERLCGLAIAHFQSVRPSLKVTEPLRFALRRIYRNLVAALAEILVRFRQERRIREAVATYQSYHLAGLKGLLENA